MRFLVLVPLALAVSVAAHGQTLTEAMQSAIEVHPEIQAGLNASGPEGQSITTVEPSRKRPISAPRASSMPCPA